MPDLRHPRQPWPKSYGEKLDHAAIHRLDLHHLRIACALIAHIRCMVDQCPDRHLITH
jgi:hypothetical protein